jgi:hypothetical protein
VGRTRERRLGAARPVTLQAWTAGPAHIPPGPGTHLQGAPLQLHLQRRVLLLQAAPLPLQLLHLQPASGATRDKVPRAERGRSADSATRPRVHDHMHTVTTLQVEGLVPAGSRLTTAWLEEPS